MKLSQDISRKYELINALSKLDKPSLRDLHIQTVIPESTIKRQLVALRNDFGMKVIFVREVTGTRGMTGHYMIMDWGVFDREKLLLWCCQS
jgi:hypothetical protein